MVVLVCNHCSAIGADVQTIAGNGQHANAGDGGSAKQAAISQTFGVVIGPDKALYICEVGSHVIRRVDSKTQKISTVAGSGTQGYSGNGGLATEAKLDEPYEVRFDKAGNMYFVEMKNHVVRKVDAATGLVSLVAGNGTAGFSGDGGLATEAQMYRPHSIVLDNDNHLYICDIGNHRIRIVDLSTGVIETFAGTGQKNPTPDGAAIFGTPLNGPRALDFDDKGSLVLALREGNSIYRIDLADKTIHHLAGTGQKGYTGDGGPAKSATLSGPKGVALSPTGDVYFADTESHTVRVIRTASGIMETVIGDGNKGNGPDGDPANCRMNRPHGVFVDASGKVYVGDTNNHCVRVLVP